MIPNQLILASGSPRRQELLRQIGIEPVIHKSRVEEVMTCADPGEAAMELSAQKAGDVADKSPVGSVILGADTVVSVDGLMLGKPKSHEDACRMIERLQGRCHQVYTGVTIIMKGEHSSYGTSFFERTDVEVYPMTQEEIHAYGALDEPMDKAGAYAIQGRFAAYIKAIQGDYGNVVGLPVGRVYQELKTLYKNREEEKDD